MPKKTLPKMYSAVKPLLIFSKIFGLFPNEIGSGIKKVSSTVAILWSLCFMSFFLLYAACTIKIGSKSASSSELIVEIGDMIYMSVSLINSFVISVSSIINRNKLTLLLHKMDQFDKELIQISDMNYTSVKKRIIASVATALFLIVVYLIIDVILFLEKVTFSRVGSEVVAYVYPLITMMIMVLQFSIIALLIQKKFQQINFMLRQIQEKWNHDTKKEVNTQVTYRCISPAIAEKMVLCQKTADGLENLRERHYELCCLSQNLNGIFGFPILITFLSLFISITFTMYFYFISDSQSKINHPVLYSAYYILNGLINCFLLLVIVKASSYTRREARLTGEIVHNFSNVSNEVETVLLEHNVEFSACRVFVLDESLIFTIIGTITTYLVIVTQFQYQQSN